MSTRTLAGHRVPGELPRMLSAMSMDGIPDPNGSGPEIAQFLATAASIHFPQQLESVVRNTPSTGGGALLLTGLLPDDYDPGVTPDHWGSASASDHLPELALVAILQLLGAPFSFTSQHGGRLVQHVVPVRGAEEAQTSWGSETFLEWHVEDAFSDERCDYFGLLCLRGDEAAATAVAPASALRLDPFDESVLRQRRFRVRPDAAHDDVESDTVCAVIGGPPTNPTIRFDPLYTTSVDPGDVAAAEALRRLGEEVQRTSFHHILRRGELLIVDNRRCVHARTPFTPRYDGADRWLLRTSVRGATQTPRPLEPAGVIGGGL